MLRVSKQHLRGAVEGERRENNAGKHRLEARLPVECWGVEAAWKRLWLEDSKRYRSAIILTTT